MELPTKVLRKKASNARPEIEEHMLVVMYKSTHEEHLSDPLQTNKQRAIQNSCAFFNIL